MNRGFRFFLSILLFVPFVVSRAAPSNVPVTIHVELDGRPADALIVSYDSLGCPCYRFYTDANEVGVARFELPAGPYALRIDHGAGFTTQVLERSVTLEPSKSFEITASLTRVFSPQTEWHYYSADLHAHSNVSLDGFTPLSQLAAVELAADLDLLFLSDHNTTAGNERFAAAARARGVPVILSEEITTPQGHWNAYPLKGTVPFIGGRAPKDHFAVARAQGARVIQANHPAASGWGYFALLGTALFDDSFDAVEIINGEFNAGDQETIQQMYSFWNQGRRYVAVGVSDDHDWKDLRTRYGRARTYVYVEGELTAEKWIDALRAGQAFVTLGPLVNFTAQKDQRPGDIIKLNRDEELVLTAELASVDSALKSAEIIKNGRVLKDYALEGMRGTVELRDTPSQDSWYLVRVVAADGDQAYTNPIWVDLQ